VVYLFFISSLLGMLRHRSLPQRLKRLKRELPQDISSTDAKKAIDEVHNLRNLAAHGDFLPERKHPLVAPTVEAFLAMCILFDLTTCSIPIRTEQQAPIVSLRHALSAISAIK
jgi:hypothetical protein